MANANGCLKEEQRAMQENRNLQSSLQSINESATISPNYSHHKDEDYPLKLK